MSKKVVALSIILAFILAVVSQAPIALASGQSEVEVLNDYQPILLPDSSLYFLKTWQGAVFLLCYNEIYKHI
jgi:hypothetical protein